ncbi:putative thiazole-containing bacteriocin maturation protein [Bacillus oleivorans]|uniref:Putative thiazole-containing bacteriocin maturation protein n=1 Tax=Bacillus oleivorans TaxID=1448271 RepID=A0A285D725_9BACI|nr:putative thiazole-containing bacteriocin maturation protein [Bacillus oleivorans]SNX75609.1 putative thiazole-containing bacteriocin maturation protein [Bacillus oleivorans]
MTKLSSYSRLKAKRDTFYLPDPQGGVYFRNNLSSFRMQGSTIYQWIERLMPLFNGEHSLEEITKGLTPPYRNRVFEIGETLYKNGFVRDVSLDRPHQLSSNILEQYASQVEFIESFTDSGAYRFQEYRQANVLAVGSGPFLVSLVSALIESGLPKFHFMVTDSVPTNRLRINELVYNANQYDSEVEVKEVPFEIGAERSFWQAAVQPYDWVLYVSQDGNVRELKCLNMICKEQGKAFLPAIYLDHVGLAGPLSNPESSETCWESAWRRIHQSSLLFDRQPQPFSSIAGSMLANVTVFEFFKKVTGAAGLNQSNQIYKLDLETLEGDWISFIPHPLDKSVSPRLVEDLEIKIKQKQGEKNQPSTLLEYFNQLTSEDTGIFHTWEERDLKQLPLSQLVVQAVNPVSEGPADLLPEVICSGFTHEEARRNAGLTGIEMYVSQMIKIFSDHQDEANVERSIGFIGIGAGETIEEAICRGLQVYLDETLSNRTVNQLNTNVGLQLETIDDKRCRFYFNALTTLNGTPTICMKEDILGFPVIAVRTNGQWYTRAGLNKTLALQNALQQALLDTQNQVNFIVRQETESEVFLIEGGAKLEVPSCDEISQLELLQSSIKVLDRNRSRLVVYDLSFEPFLKQALAGVFGVQVREEET